MTTAFYSGYSKDAKHSTKITKRHTIKRPVSIGFQTGREYSLNSPLLHSKQAKSNYSVSKTLLLRKPIGTHFKIEAGISYNNLQTSATYFTLPGKSNSLLNSSYTLPVTIQYNFLPKKCRLHPFCGAGFQCNLQNRSNQFVTPIGMDVLPQNNTPQPETKYITILFTQGVTFEVNTKIELTQCFHFMPENNSNVIGINLGVDYNLP